MREGKEKENVVGEKENKEFQQKDKERQLLYINIFTNL